LFMFLFCLSVFNLFMFLFWLPVCVIFIDLAWFHYIAICFCTCSLLIFHSQLAKEISGLFGLYYHFLSITNTVALKSLYCSPLYIHVYNNGSYEVRIYSEYLAASLIGRAVILVIIFVMTFNTDVIVFIGNVMMCSTSH
jgi:hypothetical protein